MPIGNYKKGSRYTVQGSGFKAKDILKAAGIGRQALGKKIVHHGEFSLATDPHGLTQTINYNRFALKNSYLPQIYTEGL